MFKWPQAKQFHMHALDANVRMPSADTCSSGVSRLTTSSTCTHTHTKWLFNGTHHWFMLDRVAIWKYYRRRIHQPNVGGELNSTLQNMFNTVNVQNSTSKCIGGTSCAMTLATMAKGWKFQHIHRHCVRLYKFVHVYYPRVNSVYHFNRLRCDKCLANLNVTREKKSRLMCWKMNSVSNRLNRSYHSKQVAIYNLFSMRNFAIHILLFQLKWLLHRLITIFLCLVIHFVWCFGLIWLLFMWVSYALTCIANSLNAKASHSRTKHVSNWCISIRSKAYFTPVSASSS